MPPMAAKKMGLKKLKAAFAQELLATLQTRAPQLEKSKTKSFKKMKMKPSLLPMRLVMTSG
jgi:hypothetical protein